MEYCHRRAPQWSDRDLDAVRQARQTLADATADLRFDEKEHRYFLGRRELSSVSSVVESYSTFDAYGKALDCSRNIRHEHYGKSPEEIMAIWEETARQAAEKGTVAHSYGEACFDLVAGGDGAVDAVHADRLCEAGLAASTGKEEAIAHWWNNLDLRRYIPVAKEARVVNIEAAYAGTFDVLLYDTVNKGFALRDYKTNKDLFKWFSTYLRPPLTPIKDNDYGKYTVQQNLYSIVLEILGFRVLSMQLIWLKDTGAYEEVAVPSYKALIKYALECNPPAVLPDNKQ